MWEEYRTGLILLHDLCSKDCTNDSTISPVNDVRLPLLQLVALHSAIGIYGHVRAHRLSSAATSQLSQDYSWTIRSAYDYLTCTQMKEVTVLEIGIIGSFTLHGVDLQ